MVNGKGLNPCYYTTIAQYDGLSLSQADLILPDPGSPDGYFLIHQSLDQYPNGYINTSLFYSKIDISLNNGLGAVVQKNQLIFQDSLWGDGTTACRHANGRDWWIIVLKANSPVYFIFLLTPNGISHNLTQTIGSRWDVGQTAFSSDGTKYGFYSHNDGLEIFDFDRCSGTLSNVRHVVLNDSIWGRGFCFSPDSRFAYADCALNVFQINLDSNSISSGLQIVAEWDSTYNPASPIATTFEFMQIGPDGKIYMTTVWATPNMHIIEFPDSLGSACHVQQHIISLPTTNGNTIPNFVNYSLGAINGSICDSLGLGVPEHSLHDFKLSILPNPLQDKMLHCKYQLPQNKGGVMEILDFTGRKLFRQPLHQWSTEQHLKLNIASGIYVIKIESINQQVFSKIIIP